MLNWWNSLSFMSQIYAIIAIPATVIMLVQTILLLFGIGGDEAEIDCGGDCDHDFDIGEGDGFSMISVRGLVAFFSVGGWAGVAMDSLGLGVALSIVISIAAGLLALFTIALMFRSIYKMQDSGNLDIKNAIGKSGTVYIPIPESRDGHGKIQLQMQDRFIELDAVTEENHILKTGEFVTVSGIINEQTVLVEKNTVALVK